MDVDATKRKFRAEREIERTKLEEERKRVQVRLGKLLHETVSSTKHFK